MGKLDNYVCDGQMSIFDFIAPTPTTKIESDIIDPSTLNYLSGKGWTYIRDCDKRQMKAFYLVADNGLVYAKEFMTYHFMLKFDSYAKAITGAEKFFKEAFKRNTLPQNAIEVDPFTIVDYIPMHKTNAKCDWDYTDERCSYVTPYEYKAR